MQMLARTLLTSVLLVAAAVPSGLLHAQASRDSARTDTAAKKLEAVTVTEARAVAATGGASAVVIKPEALRTSPAPLLEEALRESPFVHVRQNSRGEMELSVRGSDSRQAAVLLDGVPITLGFDHRTDPSLVPITGAQNLVIVRGLSSLLNGPNTLGGSIEVSHDNAFGQLGTGRVWGGVGVDENSAYVASLGGGRKVADVMGGSLSFRGGFAHRQRDGFALAKGAPDPTAVDGLRTNSDLRESDGFGTLRWNGAMGRALGLMVTGFTAERGVPPEEHISAPRLWRYPYHARAIAALSGNAGSFATPFGYGTLEFGAGYNTGRLKIQSYSDRRYDNVTGEELGDERTWTGRALFTHSLPKEARFKAAITAADVAYAETLPPASAADYQQRLWSAGAEVELPLTLNTTLSGGAVFDRVTTPKTGGRTAGQEAFDNAGWRLGVTHDVNAAWRVHASASQRSRFPSLRELYSGALNRFMPNPNLKPETLLGFEAGFTLDRSFGRIPDATVQVNAFHHNLDDAVVRITLPPPDSRFQRINRDRLESTGAEMLAGLAFGANRERSVTLTGDALVQKLSIFDETTAGTPSRHAENNPEVRGMLEIGVPLPHMIRAFANARYTGTQYCLNADTGTEMELRAKTEANAALERSFVVSQRGSVRSLRALVSLDNATNAAIYDQCGLPQPGRTLRLMFTVR
jgi:iron complex outermembrane receptor protein